MFLLAKHTRRSRLRAGAGSHELGVALAEYAASLRFQTSAHPTHKRGGANLNDTGYGLMTRSEGMVEPVGIEPTT